MNATDVNNDEMYLTKGEIHLHKDSTGKPENIFKFGKNFGEF